MLEERGLNKNNLDDAGIFWRLKKNKLESTRWFTKKKDEFRSLFPFLQKRQESWMYNLKSLYIQRHILLIYTAYFSELSNSTAFNWLLISCINCFWKEKSRTDNDIRAVQFLSRICSNRLKFCTGLGMTGLLFEPGKRVVVKILSRFSKRVLNFCAGIWVAIVSWIQFSNMAI